MKKTGKLAFQTVAKLIQNNLHILIAWDISRTTGEPVCANSASKSSLICARESTLAVYVSLCTNCSVVDRYREWDVPELTDVAQQWWTTRTSHSWQDWINSSTRNTHTHTYQDSVTVTNVHSLSLSVFLSLSLFLSLSRSFPSSISLSLSLSLSFFLSFFLPLSLFLSLSLSSLTCTSGSEMESLAHLAAHVHLTTLSSLAHSSSLPPFLFPSPATFTQCLSMAEDLAIAILAEEKVLTNCSISTTCTCTCTCTYSV